jgi:hypothetical protein
VRPIRLRITYKLTVAARVTMTIARLVPGRLVQGRCVRVTDQDRRRHRCTRVIHLRGVLVVQQGADGLTFTGRLRGHRLRPGTYRLTATPNNGRAGLRRTTRFTIARTARR